MILTVSLGIAVLIRRLASSSFSAASATCNCRFCTSTSCCRTSADDHSKPAWILAALWAALARLFARAVGSMSQVTLEPPARWSSCRGHCASNFRKQSPSPQHRSKRTRRCRGKRPRPRLSIERAGLARRILDVANETGPGEEVGQCTHLCHLFGRWFSYGGHGYAGLVN